MQGIWEVLQRSSAEGVMRGIPDRIEMVSNRAEKSITATNDKHGHGQKQLRRLLAKYQFLRNRLEGNDVL